MTRASYGLLGAEEQMILVAENCRMRTALEATAGQHGVALEVLVLDGIAYCRVCGEPTVGPCCR